jgi:serine/threonine-protein kinase SRPK3
MQPHSKSLLTSRTSQLALVRRQSCIRQAAFATHGVEIVAALLMKTMETPSTHTENEMKFAHVEEVEPLERYALGGYHPVCIGDLFKDRYHVVHTLGYGTFLTSWLAQDQHDNRLVAIKFARSQSDRSREGDILELLHNSKCPSTSERGKENVPSVLDDSRSTNGSHHCLATTPAMISIAEGREASHKRVLRFPESI